MPAVSVCIPVFNGGPVIEETMGSVLAQTFTDLELVVIDNCSTDDTVARAQAVDDPRVRVVVNDTNIGMCGNWNRCLEEASAEYVKIVCADDVLYSDCLARQVRLLSEQPDAVLATGTRDIIDDDGRRLMRA